MATPALLVESRKIQNNRFSGCRTQNLVFFFQINHGYEWQLYFLQTLLRHQNMILIFNWIHIDIKSTKENSKKAPPMLCFQFTLRKLSVEGLSGVLARPKLPRNFWMANVRSMLESIWTALLTLARFPNICCKQFQTVTLETCIVLPSVSNHPDVALAYHNIGRVMFAPEYGNASVSNSRARRALETFQSALQIYNTDPMLDQKFVFRVLCMWWVLRIIFFVFFVKAPLTTFLEYPQELWLYINFPLGQRRVLDPGMVMGFMGTSLCCLTNWHWALV